MNLLITGGTGFFGRALLRHLDAEERATGRLPYSRVTVLTRSPHNFSQRYPEIAALPWLSLHPGDVLSPDTLPKADKYHSILHAAADSTDAAALTPLQTYRQIVEGTENMLHFAVTCGAERFLLTSSGGVYGPQPIDMETISETHHAMPDPLNPLNAYGVSKRCAEHLCAQYWHQHGLKTVIARCFAFIGQDLPTEAHFAIGNFIRDALLRPQITVNGDGSPIRSYMHQSDLARWLFALLQLGEAGNAYNVGSDEAYSISDVANMVKTILAPEKRVAIHNNQLSDNVQRSRYVPNIAKARNQMRLDIRVSLKQAIEFHKPKGVQ